MRNLLTLNNDNSSCIQYCGWLSDSFKLNCGIRQGCPVSPLCFILAVEILSCKIRQSVNIKGICLPKVDNKSQIMKILQFADDTTLTLSDEKSLTNALEIINKFALISGLKLNKNKTEAMWFGENKLREQKT